MADYSVEECKKCQHSVALAMERGRPGCCSLVPGDGCAYDNFLSAHAADPVLMDKAAVSAEITRCLNLCDPQGRVAIRLGAMVVAWLDKKQATKIAQTVLTPGVLSVDPVCGVSTDPRKDALGRTIDKGVARVVIVVEVPFE